MELLLSVVNQIKKITNFGNLSHAQIPISKIKKHITLEAVLEELLTFAKEKQKTSNQLSNGTSMGIKTKFG